MDVRRSFILSLYGISGVLIEYFAHKRRYFDFRHFETQIFVILRLFLTLMTQNPRNEPTASPQMAYGS